VKGAQAHYAALLGGVYAWSTSVRGDPFARAWAWILDHGLEDATSYLDLGAGFGAHTLPLLRAGKRVTAVDFEDRLLAALQGALGEHRDRATIYHGDLNDFLSGGADAQWEVILCLGDTLTHLADAACVQRLLRDAKRRLTPGGRLALSYRDSTGFDAEGSARFLPVAADAKRTMHCLLEAIDDDHLRVTDIVTEVGPEGPRTRISDYIKLRLAPAKVCRWAADVGLTGGAATVEGGMVTLILHRPR